MFGWIVSLVDHPLGPLMPSSLVLAYGFVQWLRLRREEVALLHRFAEVRPVETASGAEHGIEPRTGDVLQSLTGLAEAQQRALADFGDRIAHMLATSDQEKKQLLQEIISKVNVKVTPAGEPRGLGEVPTDLQEQLFQLQEAYGLLVDRLESWMDDFSESGAHESGAGGLPSLEPLREDIRQGLASVAEAQKQTLTDLSDRVTQMLATCSREPRFQEVLSVENGGDSLAVLSQGTSVQARIFQERETQILLERLESWMDDSARLGVQGTELGPLREDIRRGLAGLAEAQKQALIDFAGRVSQMSASGNQENKQLLQEMVSMLKSTLGSSAREVGISQGLQEQILERQLAQQRAYDLLADRLESWMNRSAKLPGVQQGDDPLVSRLEKVVASLGENMENALHRSFSMLIETMAEENEERVVANQAAVQKMEEQLNGRWQAREKAEHIQVETGRNILFQELAAQFERLQKNLLQAKGDEQKIFQKVVSQFDEGVALLVETLKGEGRRVLPALEKILESSPMAEGKAPSFSGSLALQSVVQKDKVVMPRHQAFGAGAPLAKSPLEQELQDGSIESAVAPNWVVANVGERSSPEVYADKPSTIAEPPEPYRNDVVPKNTGRDRLLGLLETFVKQNSKPQETPAKMTDKPVRVH